MAAAIVTVAETTYTSMKQIAVTWTSATDGSAVIATTHAYDGLCQLLTTIPGTAGSAPTDNYDITITDANGVDVLATGGMNRSASATQQVLASSLGGVAGSVLTFTLANAGAVKTGVCYLLIR